MKVEIDIAEEISDLNEKELKELKDQLWDCYDFLLMEPEELRDFDEDKVKRTLRILFGLNDKYHLPDIIDWICDMYCLKNTKNQ